MEVTMKHFPFLPVNSIMFEGPEIVYIPQNIPLYPGEVFAKLPEKIYPGVGYKYAISNYGRLYNFNSNIFTSTRPDKDGYRQASLFYNNQRYNIKIHQLVLQAFQPIPKSTNIIPNHLDGHKDNNKIDNLEWATYSENTKHAIENGLLKITGEDNYNTTISAEQAKQICDLLDTEKYTSIQISKIIKCSENAVRNIKNGISWKDISKNYNFRKYEYSRTPSGNPDVIYKGSSLRTLSSDKVHEICQYIESGKYTAEEISIKLNVDKDIICNIKRGSIYKEISSQYDMSVNKIRKFSPEDVEKMCQDIISDKHYSQNEIARRNNTSKHMIYALKKGEIWRDITRKYGIID